jgi:hypothetical protein
MPKSKHQVPGRVRSTYAFIKAHRDQYSVRMMCRILGVAVSDYCLRLQRPISNHDQEDARLLRLIRASFVRSLRLDGVLCPYLLPGQVRPVTHRLRRDHPDFENGKPKNKYLCAIDAEAEHRRVGSLRQLDQRRKVTAMKLERGYDEWCRAASRRSFGSASLRSGSRSVGDRRGADPTGGAASLRDGDS